MLYIIQNQVSRVNLFSQDLVPSLTPNSNQPARSDSQGEWLVAHTWVMEMELVLIHRTYFENEDLNLRESLITEIHVQHTPMK